MRHVKHIFVVRLMTLLSSRHMQLKTQKGYNDVKSIDCFRDSGFFTCERGH